MAKITNAKVYMHGTNEQIPCDCFGNNAAIECPACHAQPVLLIARVDQRGSSPSKSATCRSCKARIHIMDDLSQDELNTININVLRP